MPFGVAQAEGSLSPTNIPHLLINSSLFYYILAICSELVNISPMNNFKIVVKLILPQNNLCLLAEEDFTSQVC